MTLEEERDWWRAHSEAWQGVADSFRDLCRRQGLQIKELTAIAHEAIEVIQQGRDPEDPR